MDYDSNQYSLSCVCVLSGSQPIWTEFSWAGSKLQAQSSYAPFIFFSLSQHSIRENNADRAHMHASWSAESEYCNQLPSTDCSQSKSHGHTQTHKYTFSSQMVKGIIQEGQRIKENGNKNAITTETQTQELIYVNLELRWDMARLQVTREVSRVSVCLHRYWPSLSFPCVLAEAIFSITSRGPGFPSDHICVQPKTFKHGRFTVCPN